MSNNGTKNWRREDLTGKNSLSYPQSQKEASAEKFISALVIVTKAASYHRFHCRKLKLNALIRDKKDVLKGNNFYIGAASLIVQF